MSKIIGLPPFRPLDELLAAAGALQESRRGRMEEHALTNFIKAPYQDYVDVPPPKDFVNSREDYERRIRRLKPRAYLVMMGKSKEEERNHNPWAIEVIKSVNSKARLFQTYHPRYYPYNRNNKVGAEMRGEVKGFLKELGLI